MPVKDMPEKESVGVARDLKSDILYVISALKQRKEALSHSASDTTNPLDRLCLSERINEIDGVVSYLESITK